MTQNQTVLTRLTDTAAGYGDTPCWMLIDGVEVHAPSRVTGSVVALGDSTTIRRRTRLHGARIAQPGTPGAASG